VGDPFTEKLLLEASLEAIRSGYVVGIQDMGAAGITCSTSEMSARGEVGMNIDLDRVPARESGMTAYELMLSESQERMLVVVEQGHEEDVKAIFDKWDLHAEIIGEIVEGGRLRITYQGRLVADVPAHALVLGGGAPVYIREAREPEYLQEVRRFDLTALPLPEDLTACLLKLLSGPNIASKRWVFEQYDSMVRTNNVVLCSADAAVVYVKEAHKALALKTDCNGKYVFLNPRRGGMIAVAESARNVACTGAVPLAITNCLNFGNPYKPGVYWQFMEAVAGMGEACRAFDTPVTGGNVSFYNESPSASVYPTPVVGMLGLIEDVTKVCSAAFRDEGDDIIVLGSTKGHLGGSEYLSAVHGVVAGDAPDLNLTDERALQALVIRLIGRGYIKSAHDCSEGGIAVALAECCIAERSRTIGAVVHRISAASIRPDAILFGEDQSRIVISSDPLYRDAIMDAATDAGIPAEVIGVVGGERLRIGKWVDVAVAEIEEGYYESIGKRMNSAN
jgi:phosphoribosylformylglycinamidine synthase